MKAYRNESYSLFERRGRTWLATLVALFVVAALATGCASWRNGDDEVDVSDEPEDERARHGNLVYDDFDVEKADLNGNDQPDQWTFYDEEGRIVRVERDMNFDGSVDMWQYYDASGELIEEEMALGKSGNVDVVAFYSEGKVIRKLMASEFENTFPIEKFYDGQEQLLRVERDSSGNGSVDVWEYYQDGERQRIGWDTSGDGQPDSFDQH